MPPSTKVACACGCAFAPPLRSTGALAATGASQSSMAVMPDFELALAVSRDAASFDDPSSLGTVTDVVLVVCCGAAGEIGGMGIHRSYPMRLSSAHPCPRPASN